MSRVWLALSLAAAAAAVPCLPGYARAQGSGEEVASNECCQTLRYPVGARVAALATALTARAMPDALYVNPAGIAGLDTNEFRVHSERSDLNKTTTFALTFGIGGAGTAALSYRLLDWGETQTTDVVGNVTGTMSLTDNLLTASFATSLVPRVKAGVTYKLFQWRQDCTGSCQSASGTTNAVDLGMQLEVPWASALRLGASVTHLGLPLQVVNAAQSDPAPTRVRLGAAYELLHHFRPDSTVQLIASADLVRGVRPEAEGNAAAGLELILDGTMFVRAGYATGSGKGTGGSVGVGMIWERFDVSVAKSFIASDDGTEPFQVTFAVAF